jgi:hypothetical protein
MNPFSLLTKGHTFQGIRDRRGAYKLPTRSALPSFAGPKGPSFAAPQPAPEPSQAALFEQAAPAAPAVVPPKSEAAVPAVPLAAIKPAAAPPAPDGLWRRAANWCKELVSRRKRPAARAGGVQTELALEKVTVVRNDLSEDDLEVVTVARKAGLEETTREPAQTGNVQVEQQTTHP